MSGSLWGCAARPAARLRVPFSASVFAGALLAVAALLVAAPARADPCEGRLPNRIGERFSGVVRYVGDGDSLCVGDARDPATWIEVRLADHDAAELNRPGGRAARERLVALVMGRRLSCEIVRGRNGRTTSWDRVIARCRLDGRPLGRLLAAR